MKAHSSPQSGVVRITAVILSFTFGCGAAFLTLRAAQGSSPPKSSSSADALRAPPEKLIEVPPSVIDHLGSQAVMTQILADDSSIQDTSEEIRRILEVDDQSAWLIKSILQESVSSWLRRCTVHPPEDKSFQWELKIAPDSQAKILETLNSRAKTCLKPHEQVRFEALCVIELRHLLSASSILLKNDNGRVTMRLMPSGRETVFSAPQENPHCLLMQMVNIAQKYER